MFVLMADSPLLENVEVQETREARAAPDVPVRVPSEARQDFVSVPFRASKNPSFSHSREGTASAVPIEPPKFGLYP
jgi:hypothetical protein